MQARILILFVILLPFAVDAAIWLTMTDEAPEINQAADNYRSGEIGGDTELSLEDRLRRIKQLLRLCQQTYVVQLTDGDDVNGIDKRVYQWHRKRICRRLLDLLVRHGEEVFGQPQEERRK